MLDSWKSDDEVEEMFVWLSRNENQALMSILLIKPICMETK